MMYFPKIALALVVLLAGCHQKAGSDDVDPIESSSIPINGQGTDPLYTRLLAVLGDLPALATLIKSGVVDSVLCNPRSCAGDDQGTCGLVRNLSAPKREMCIRSLKSNVDGIAAFGARGVTSLFREATRPLVMKGADGKRRRMTAMVRPGPDGHVAVDRALAMALSYKEFAHAMMHELVGHMLPNPATGNCTGDLSASPPFTDAEPGREYADTVVAALDQLIVETLSTMPGTLDHTFNDSGTVVDIPTRETGLLNAVHCSGNGNVLALGPLGISSILTRYRLDGSLDTDFGETTGRTGFQISGAPTVGLSMTEQNEKLVIAGYYIPGDTRPLLVRVDKDGHYDKAFHAPADKLGMIAQPFDVFPQTGFYALATRVHPLPDGGLLVVGARFTASYWQSYVLRLTALLERDVSYAAEGTIQPGYAASAVYDTEVSGPVIRNDSVLASDGSLFLLSYGLVGNVSALWLSKYSPGGLLDRQFGTNGMVGIPMERNERPAAGAVARLFLRPDGDLILAHNLSDDGGATFRFLVAKVTADGSGLDPTFGSGGRMYFPATGSARLRGGDLALQPDGKILLGTSRLGGDYNFLVTRFTADGKPDPTFNGGLPALKDFGARQDILMSLCLQPGGKIVAGGFASDVASLWELARFNNH